MPPTGYFGSTLRRSIVLASFVRALAEAGSRRWSADKLSARSHRQWCSRQRLSNSHDPALPVHKVDFCACELPKSAGDPQLGKLPKRRGHASVIVGDPFDPKQRGAFIAPLRGCFYFHRWSRQAAALVPTRFNPDTSDGSCHGPFYCSGRQES